MNFVKECFKYQLIGFMIELLYEGGKIVYKSINEKVD